LSIGVTIGALAGAVAAALLTGARISPISGTAEGLSSSFATVLTKLGQNLPVGYAVGAGMVAAVNPCGFPMLPAYLGLFVGTGAASEPKRRIGRRLMRAIVVSLTMTGAFMLLFAGVGIALSRGLHALTQAFPAIGLVVGVRAYFAYGLAYALVSLSCTLPIFLVVVGGTVTSSGPGAALLEFILYATGMGLVITLLTVGISLVQVATLRSVRRVLPYVQPVSAGGLLLAGAYLIYYWLTVGGILRSAIP
jgi:cytochrome c biogenesis protein CcdA